MLESFDDKGSSCEEAVALEEAGACLAFAAHFLLRVCNFFRISANELGDSGEPKTLSKLLSFDRFSNSSYSSGDRNRLSVSPYLIRSAFHASVPLDA